MAAPEQSEGEGWHGELYIVPTPIGNLEDMSPRGIRILASVHRILAEDTRHTGFLCRHFGIATPQVSFHEHNLRERLPRALAWLREGRSLALVSDAGTPGVSDPGEELVAHAVAAGARVTPLPGPFAGITALVASGLPSGKFVFEGFLPRQEGKRRARLAQLDGEERTVILYEAPHRLAELLASLAGVCGGERRVVVARELTKLHETYYRGTAAELAALFVREPPKGEAVVLLSGRVRELTGEGAARERLHALLAGGEKLKTAARMIAEESGLSGAALYKLGLAWKEARE